MPETIKPEQWSVQNQQLTHHSTQGEDTSHTCAADMEQISIWLAKNTGNE